MIAPCYAISIKSHTDRQTDRATTRGPIGPKNQESDESGDHGDKLLLRGPDTLATIKLSVSYSAFTLFLIFMWVSSVCKEDTLFSQFIRIEAVLAAGCYQSSKREVSGNMNY